MIGDYMGALALTLILLRQAEVELEPNTAKYSQNMIQ
jgi:hypothetical protein